MYAQLSARLTLSLIITLAIISTLIITITYVKAQLDGFGTTTAATLTAIAGQSFSKSPSSEKQFSAVLTGDNEVPPVNTDAAGRIKLTTNSQQNALDYELSISNLNGIVTGAHIHRGSVGTNGPIVADLKNIGGASAYASAGNGGSAMTSTSIGGTITSADLKGPLSGKQISDLIRLIQDGKAYVNVHTDQKPNGEIRGQLKPLSTSSNTASEAGASTMASTSPSASASATAP
jgi:CHRD domain-containing protein